MMPPPMIATSAVPFQAGMSPPSSPTLDAPIISRITKQFKVDAFGVHPLPPDVPARPPLCLK